MSAELSPKPYRIEWRFSPRDQWQLHHECEEHEEAIELADEATNHYGGHARVVVQHVIYRSGGARARAA